MIETKATGDIATDTATDTATDAETEADLWEGIPAALVERGYSYDRDTAGGCG